MAARLHETRTPGFCSFSRSGFPLSALKKLSLLVLTAAASAGCTCADTGVFEDRFACTDNGQCAAGFVCDLNLGECVKDRGDAGQGGGSGGGMGQDAGPPALVLTSAPQTVTVGSCSMPVTFELRNAEVTSPASVTFAADPLGGLSLFRGPGCSDAGTLTVQPGSSSGSFSFLALDAGAFRLSFSTVDFGQATQLATTVFPMPSAVAFRGVPQTVRAGDCSGPIEVELRDSTDAGAAANAPVNIGLTSMPAGLSFFSDANCSAPITQATIPFGASRAAFRAQSDTGAAYTINAAAMGLSPGSRTHTVLPMVRTGQCTLADGSLSATCTFLPPVLLLSDSFVVFQVSSGSNVAGALALLCELTGTGTLQCRRGQSDGDAVVSFQVAEVKGATVRKVETYCDGGLSMPLVPAAPAGSTFVLSANQNNGNVIDDSDFDVGRLNDAGTAVDFDFGGTCGGPQSLLAQVVTLPNIVVTHGTVSISAADSALSLVEAPAPQSGVLFAQWRGATNSPGICDRTVRASLQGTSLDFSRANGSTTAFCTASVLGPLSYDKVDFRNTASVQQVNVTMGVGTTMSTSTVAAVDRTRTLVFSGSQASTGQALGEGTHQGTTNTTDYLGDVSATFTFASPTQLTSRRASSLGASRWTAFVVELKP